MLTKLQANRVLGKIHAFLKAHKTGQCVDDWCLRLWKSIKAGGPAPDWGKYELGASYYRCRAVYHDKGQFLG